MTLSLTFKDLLNEKLAYRTKNDLQKLVYYIDRNDAEDLKIKLQSSNFPSYFSICGHVNDFITIMNEYNK